MKAQRYQFRVQKNGADAMVIMDCDGLLRCRTMPMTILKKLAKACRQVRTDVIDVLLKDRKFDGRIPQYPGCVEVAAGDRIAGVCDLRVVVSKDGDSVEFCIALYDPGDTSAPVLVLINEQLEDFVRQVRAIAGKRV